MKRVNQVSESNGRDQVVLMAQYRRGIRLFIKNMWGLEPQPVKPEYAEEWETVCRSSGDHWENMKKSVKATWFGDPVYPDRPDLDWNWYSLDGSVTSREEFLQHKYYSWQQNLILIGVEKAIAGDAKRLLSTVSGHGIGKSATCSWIILWFLYCFLEAQVPVTAPTSHQMHDVLWKELSIWIKRMPDDTADMYEWTSDYVRMTYSPESWFARARTSTKENTEAIAGVHADHVAIVVDEASGVPQQVFETAEGALTSGNVFVILISNGTQTIGYFFDSHHKSSADWQTFRFNGEESPLVDRGFIALKRKRHGGDSEEYKIRVKGGFPGEDVMDTSGYIQLIPNDKIHVRVKSEFAIPMIGRVILGVDPSGEGKDRTTYVLRDRFKAEKIFERLTSNDKQIAEDILTFIDRYNIRPEDVVVGAFGKGADVGKEVAIATADQKNGPYVIYTVMEGNSPEAEEEYNYKFFERKPDELQNPESNPDQVIDMYLNIRALMYFRATKWIIAGGQIVDVTAENSDFAEELKVIRYKRSLQGNKIQLMPKKEMLKLGISSPNIADAFSLTFLRELNSTTGLTARQMEEENDDSRGYDDDKFSAL